MTNVAAPSTFSFADLQVMSKSSQVQADSLKEAVTQFESLFVNMMLKSMRDANSVLSEGSYLHSSEIQMHQQMLDQQLAVHLSEQGGIGLSEPLLRQLSGGLMPHAPSELAIGSESPLVQPQGATRTESAVASLRTADRTPAAAEPTITTVTQQALSQQEVPTIKPADADSFGSPLAFVQGLLPTFRRVLAATPISPVTALAQAALETGWGSRQMQASDGEPARNLFGIKADNWSGKSATHQTLEFSGDTPIPKRATFRAYDSWDASVSDYASLLSNNARYEPAMANAGHPEDFLRGLQAGGYATDPDYADKILAVLAKVEDMLR